MTRARGACGRAWPMVLAVIVLTVAIALFASACGTLHGAPRCGPLSALATPVSVLALMLESLLFNAPQTNGVVRGMVWAVSAALAAALVGAAGAVRRIARGVASKP